jgi:hypothetical protein
MRNAEEFVFQALGLGLMEIDSYGRVWWIRRQQTSRTISRVRNDVLWKEVSCERR